MTRLNCRVIECSLYYWKLHLTHVKRRVDILNFQNVLEDETHTRKSYVYFFNYFHSNRLFVIPCINIYWLHIWLHHTRTYRKYKLIFLVRKYCSLIQSMLFVNQINLNSHIYYYVCLRVIFCNNLAVNQHLR